MEQKSEMMEFDSQLDVAGVLQGESYGIEVITSLTDLDDVAGDDCGRGCVCFNTY